MSKMTTLAGPPRVSGTLDRIRASVKAVATSPSASTCKRARRFRAANAALKHGAGRGCGVARERAQRSN